MRNVSFPALFFSPLRRLFANRRAVLEVSALLGLCLAVLLSGRCLGFAQTAGAVRRDTLRLHVQASSNTPAEQLRKLQVRDAVLREAETLFAAAPDKTAALRTARAALPRLQLTAEQAYTAAGGAPGSPVRVRLVEMYFATTRYAAATLPAGRYDALRVELGRHAGRNWFCVLYPALCLGAAEGASYPTGQEQALVEGGYELRFAALEWLQRLTGQADAEAVPAPDAAEAAPGQSDSSAAPAPDSAPAKRAPAASSSPS